jgi:hypothetical protein
MSLVHVEIHISAPDNIFKINNIDILEQVFYIKSQTLLLA